MGSMFSMFSKPDPNPNKGVWNGHKYTNASMAEREEYFGGNNKTNKTNNTRKNKVQKQKSFRRKK
jgi:hypothetical protein